MVFRLIVGLLCLTPLALRAQPLVVDEIVAVVGDNYILRSDIDKEFETLREQMGNESLTDSVKIKILDRLIAKRILLYKAQLDSIIVNDDRVNAEMERKLAYILQHFGGDEKAMENYLGMSLPEFKDKTREKMREQLLIDEMENQVIGNVKVTPAEVRKFYNSIPVDSLEPIEAEVEVAQIIILPKVSDAAKEYAKQQAEDIRLRIIKGEDFCLMAKFYSEDPGSSGKCGSLGFFTRGKMVPEFEAAAFRLQKDSISRVIESEFGYHIIKQVERRGESVHVQHILISPRLVNSDIYKAGQKMDSVINRIKNHEMTFMEAASKYSDDENTRSSGGKLIDPNSGSSKLTISQLDKDTYMAIKDLKPGDMSPVRLVATPDGKQVYVVFMLISEIDPHTPDLEHDYLKIQAAALARKKNETLENWIRKYKSQYYIKISDRYRNEPELAHWQKK